MRKAIPTLSAAALALVGLTACGGSVFDLEVGQCANTADVEMDGGMIADLPATDCEEPHDLEAYASTDLEGDEFPGDDVVGEQAWNFCETEFENFVGISLWDSEYGMEGFVPTADSWDDLGDRQVLCFVVSADPVTGSLEGAAN